MATSSTLPVVQYWNTDPPPDYITRLFGSVAEKNPDLTHLVFSERSAEAWIAEHFSPREVAAFRACAVPAMQADYFRYCAVFVLGGVYCDADALCVESFRTLIEATSRGRLYRRPRGGLYNGFFVFREAGHPLLQMTLDIATANIQSRAVDDLWTGPGPERVWMTTGPAIFTALEMLRGKGSFRPLLDYTAGRPEEPLAKLLCDTVGDPRRIDAAFDGVETVEPAEATRYIRVPDFPLPYKETGVHYARFEGSIFR